jgi:hypothetical protein
MIEILRDWLQRAEPWLAEALALAGAFVFALQVRTYALTQLSVLDEGAYLMKGYWFLTGQYRPYQDFGPLTNHMPLAFLIPGAVQAWFGPGLGPARAFAALIALFFLLGLFLLVRRLGGRWWAAAAVLAVALNPATIKFYSVAVTQGLIAAMLVWTLWFALGEERKQWHLMAGSALAALMALTRLNMTPVLFLLLAYIFWRHGRKAGLQASALGLGIWLLGHALYWPGILQMWANYLPEALTPFLANFRDPAKGLESWRSNTSLFGRWTAFLEGLRFNFLPLASALAAGLLWPRRKEWGTEWRRKAAVFVAVLLVLMLAAHAVVSLGGEYCVFCFPLYISFFSALPFILLVLVWPDRSADPGRIRWAALALVLLFALAAHGSLPLISSQFPPANWVRGIALIEVPRIEGLRIQEGRVPLWGLLEGRFGMTYEQSIEGIHAVLGNLLLLLGGALLGWALLALARRGALWPGRPHFERVLGVLLLAGLLLSPSGMLGGGYRTYDCGENVIEAYARLGAELDERVPDGALVFWRGGRSAVPLLYLTDIQTFPTQLNGDYTYRLGGDAEELEPYGLWNEELMQRWLREADIILVEEDLLRTWLAAALNAANFDESPPTQPLVSCRERTAIAIYTYQP